MHRAQRLAGQRAGGGRPTERHANEFAAELVDREGLGECLGNRQQRASQGGSSNDDAQGHDKPETDEDHSIDGSTRSGGRWPSMNVRMLIMTFSPMSIRPSMVAEPMC